MLELAQSLPGYMVFYNGPECGASAPDHMHFQAAKYDELPIFRSVERATEGLLDHYPSTAFVLNDTDQLRLDEKFSSLVACLEARDPGRVEPMVNVVVSHDADCWRTIVFPRSKHRPELYHTGELTWSPGSIDLCGVIVLPVPSDLQKITTRDIEEVFREVSLTQEIASEIAHRLELK